MNPRGLGAPLAPAMRVREDGKRRLKARQEKFYLDPEGNEARPALYFSCWPIIIYLPGTTLGTITIPTIQAATKFLTQVSATTLL
jgi:hypothetical protein